LGEKPALERYDRQLRLEGWDQYRLMSSRVLVAGVGALGCEIAKNLALMGVGELILVDYDVVELSNLSRQMLYDDHDVGKPKAAVAEEKIRRMNPHVSVAGLQRDIRQLPQEVFANVDVLVSCVDNWPTRRWFNSVAVLHNRLLVDVAVDGYYGNVQVIVPRKTACIECHGDTLIPTDVQAAECSLRRRKPEDLVKELSEKAIDISLEIAEEFFKHNIKTVYDVKYAPQHVVEKLSKTALETLQTIRSKLNPKMPALQSISATIAGVGSFEVVRLLHGGALGEPFSGLYVFDGLSGRLSRIRLDRNMLCHVCGLWEDSVVEVEAALDETVGDVKEKIANRFLFPDPQIQMGPRLLDDGHTLAEIGVRDGEVFYVHTTRRAEPLQVRVRLIEARDQRG
jgi:ubiquitin-activating enzyme E1 C